MRLFQGYFFFLPFRAARRTRFFVFTVFIPAAPDPTHVLVWLFSLMTFTTLPLLFPPEPENALVTLFGELFAVSPKLIFPTLLVIVTFPTKVGKTPPSSLRNRLFPSYSNGFAPAWTIVEGICPIWSCQKKSPRADESTRGERTIYCAV